MAKHKLQQQILQLLSDITALHDEKVLAKERYKADYDALAVCDHVPHIHGAHRVADSTLPFCCSRSAQSHTVPYSTLQYSWAHRVATGRSQSPREDDT